MSGLFFNVSPFIRALPKAELHLHLEGTVSPQTLSELSRKHNTPMPVENNRYAINPDSGSELTVADVERLYEYTDFQGFLMAFKAVTERLRTPEDYELITYRMLQQLRDENVFHAEAFVSVGVIHWRGQEFEHIFEGLERGRITGERDFGVSLLWIFDAVRNFGADEAYKVADEAVAYRERQLAETGKSSVVGIGIGGDELRGAPELFRNTYRYAANHDLRLTAHAGENAGPGSIWGALNIGAERLGHGLNAFQDAELIEHLAEKQIPVEVCISSNLRTGCCKRIEDHPVKKMFDAGVMITLNTDDPAMFGTSLNKEYQLAQDVFGFSDEQLREIARNSFEASFLGAEEKVGFLDLLDAQSTKA
ncbi:MAG: adenosine deaminase [Acidobacteriales bacterium]|nr:adenosine deaminase [Terriglobales bacterium]